MSRCSAASNQRDSGKSFTSPNLHAYTGGTITQAGGVVIYEMVHEKDSLPVRNQEL